MTSAAIASAFPDLSVSRETMARLQAFVALLVKWNGAINLVSKSTLQDAWTRHIVDSVQIFGFGAEAKSWVDLGSGGGFPGLVVAILAAETAPDMQVTLVESDQRKATFLRQAAQTLGLKARVLSERIENLAPLCADVISARALAPLGQLCAFSAQHAKPSGRSIFLKGKSAASEIADAQKDWTFRFQSHTSVTDPSAVVLLLEGIAHV